MTMSDVYLLMVPYQKRDRLGNINTLKIYLLVPLIFMIDINSAFRIQKQTQLFVALDGAIRDLGQHWFKWWPDGNKPLAGPEYT